MGDSEALSVVERAMSDHYAIKVRAILGDDPDLRHAELIVKSFNQESAKGVTTPSVKRLENVLTKSPQLDTLQTRKYRSVVMKAAYLSQGRSDLSYSTKELTQDMQKPTEQSMTIWKRLGRYLQKRPRFEQLFFEQASTVGVVRLDVYGDSDHAGCLKTRKSTTRMVLMRDAHDLKVSSHTQSTISFSSGESECYGIVKCAAIGLGAKFFFHVLACVLTSWYALTRPMDWQLVHDEGVASDMCRLVSCGYSNEYSREIFF